MEHRLAQQIHKARYIQSSDPGAVGAGVEWLDTTTTPAIHKKRNAANDGWDVIFDPSDYALAADVTTEIAAAVSALVAGAPGALDTLNELAAALGDDASFSASVASALADLDSRVDTLEAGGSGAPTDAEYLVATANGSLSAERVTTDTATVAWDHGTAGQAKANVPNNAITDAKLADMAAVSVKGRSANSSGDPADIAAASNGQFLRRRSNAVGFGAIQDDELPITAWAALTDGATITWDVSGTRESKKTVTLGGNRTLSITNAVNGSSGIVIVTQDGTGGRTLTLPAGSKIVGGGGTSPTLSSDGGAVDILAFEYDGTTYWWTVGRGAA